MAGKAGRGAGDRGRDASDRGRVGQGGSAPLCQRSRLSSRHIASEYFWGDSLKGSPVSSPAHTQAPAQTNAASAVTRAAVMIAAHTADPNHHLVEVPLRS